MLANFVASEGPLSGWQIATFKLYPNMAQRELSSLVTLLLNTNPIKRALLSSPNDIPKTPPPNTITLGLRVSALEFWGIHKIQPRTGKGKFSRVDILFKR